MPNVACISGLSIIGFHSLIIPKRLDKHHTLLDCDLSHHKYNRKRKVSGFYLSEHLDFLSVFFVFAWVFFFFFFFFFFVLLFFFLGTPLRCVLLFNFLCCLFCYSSFHSVTCACISGLNILECPSNIHIHLFVCILQHILLGRDLNHYDI